MKLLQVTNRSTENLFLDVPREIYRNDANWVCPLDSDLRSVFDPSQNRFFNDGDAIRWVLMDKNAKPVGRIAAFYNMKKARSQKVLAGSAGYFECINDQTAADLLFDKAGEWLKIKGFKAMDASVNFGENDTNWGVLVEGFTHPGIGMSYNLPYYQNLFENYGFHTFYRQFTYHLDLTKEFPARFWKIAEWVKKKPDFRFEHFTINQSERFIRDLIHIHNATWNKFKEDSTRLEPDVVRESFKKAKFILDEEIIWFAYYKNVPISFFIMFLDANQILKEFKGKMNLWNMLRFIYYRRTKKITRVRAIAAGVVPKFQNSGIESGIFWHLNEKMKSKPHIKEIELSWVGDYNPKMISLYESVGSVKAKTHHTYRYMLDKSVPFERFMPEKAIEAN